MIVFTHSLGFLGQLLEQAKRHKTALSTLTLVKRTTGAGVVTDDVPREIQKFKGLIGELRTDCQRARGPLAKSNPSVYDAVIAKICRDLRMAVERAVEEVLLSEVVGRYQRAVHLANIPKLVAIVDEDIEVLDGLATKYSRSEHSQTSETRSPPPGIDEIERDVDSLTEWAVAFRKRA